MARFCPRFLFPVGSTPTSPNSLQVTVGRHWRPCAGPCVRERAALTRPGSSLPAGWSWKGTKAATAAPHSPHVAPAAPAASNVATGSGGRAQGQTVSVRTAFSKTASDIGRRARRLPAAREISAAESPTQRPRRPSLPGTITAGPSREACNGRVVGQPEVIGAHTPARPLPI